MASTSITTPVRQPFGNVSQARLRNLTNLKNSQSSLGHSTPAFHKSAVFEDTKNNDENLAPLLFSTSSKTSKNFDFSASKPQKPLQLTPSPIKLTLIPASSPAPSRKRKAEDASTPLNDDAIRRPVPRSAPSAPAGRSPPLNRARLLSRRRGSDIAFTRMDPPPSINKMPFSLRAALAGAVQPKRKSLVRSWDFKIYEETPVEQMANVMEHSTNSLDISDDESCPSTKADCDDKENIAPEGHTTLSNGPINRRDIMTDSIRSPLGNLVAADFYADGLDETSEFIDASEEAVDNIAIQETTPSLDAIINAPIPSIVKPAKKTLKETSLSLHIPPKPIVKEKVSLELSDYTPIVEASEIQIWESGSAKDESEIDPSVEDETLPL